jgi:hypothetical protein
MGSIVGSQDMRRDPAVPTGNATALVYATAT